MGNFRMIAGPSFPRYPLLLAEVAAEGDGVLPLELPLQPLLELPLKHHPELPLDLPHKYAQVRC